MYNRIIQFIEKDTKKIVKLMKEHLEYQQKKMQAEKWVEKQDELAREIKEHHKLTGEETVNREIPGQQEKHGMDA